MAKEITISNYYQGSRPRQETLKRVLSNYFLTALIASGMGGLLVYINERLFVAILLLAIGITCAGIGIFHLMPRSFTVSGAGVAFEGRGWSKEAGWDDILEVRSTFGDGLYPLFSITPKLVVITRTWKADLPGWKYCLDDIQEATVALAKGAGKGTRLVDELGWMPTADEAEAYSQELDKFYILAKVSLWVFLSTFLVLGFFGINTGTFLQSSSMDQPWVDAETAGNIRAVGMTMLVISILVALISIMIYRSKKKKLEKEAG